MSADWRPQALADLLRASLAAADFQREMIEAILLLGNKPELNDQAQDFVAENWKELLELRETLIEREPKLADKLVALLLGFDRALPPAAFLAVADLGLASTSNSLRLAAVDRSLKRGDRKQRGVEAAALSDSSTVVVKRGLQALIQRGASAVSAHYEEILKHRKSRNRAVRTEVCRALSLLERERAEPPLAALIADPERVVRRQALQSLFKVLKEDATPYLLLALQDIAPVVRVEASGLLGDVKRDGVAEALLDRLNDISFRVRVEAFGSLAKLDRSLALRHLDLAADSANGCRILFDKVGASLEERAAIAAQSKYLRDEAFDEDGHYREPEKRGRYRAPADDDDIPF